jgi:hypothetical protein
MFSFDTSLAVDLFGLFSRAEMALTGRTGCTDAVIAIQALSSVFKTVDGLDDVAREAGLKGLAITISPLGGNGIGDAVIWPALRKTGLHALAEELTVITNAVRASIYADSPTFVAVAETQESKVAGLKSFFQETYGELDSEHLTAMLDDVILDASDLAASEANNGGLDGQLAFLVLNGWSPAQVQSAAMQAI